MGLMPRELQADEVTAYVRALAIRIGRSSELSAPLRVTLFDNLEISAFALPGRCLYIHRGLFEAVEDESQLVGVTTLDGHHLMTKASVE